MRRRSPARRRCPTFRAGADILITYYAKELAGWIDEGRIG